MGIKEVLKKSRLICRIYNALYNGIFSAATVISPKLNTKMIYKSAFGKKLDLDNPKTLNEKILWLKLNRYMNDPLVIKCADKYAVREYIEECGCGEILNDLIAVWDSVDEIKWNELPDQFVIKWNFGAGMNIICDNKATLDINQTKKKLKRWGKNKYWLRHSEMQYKYAPKKMICEKYLNDGTGAQPTDYKVYCFNGKAEYIMICVGRALGLPKFYFYDREWNLCRLNRDSIDAPKDFAWEKPNCIDAIFEYAEMLASPFPFVRADFYAINDAVYFGELTFTPAGGVDSSRLPETDVLFGEKVDLNYNKNL